MLPKVLTYQRFSRHAFLLLIHAHASSLINQIVCRDAIYDAVRRESVFRRYRHRLPDSTYFAACQAKKSALISAARDI